MATELELEIWAKMAVLLGSGLQDKDETVDDLTAPEYCDDREDGLYIESKDALRTHSCVYVGIDPAKPGSGMCVKATFIGPHLISFEEIT